MDKSAATLALDTEMTYRPPQTSGANLVDSIKMKGIEDYTVIDAFVVDGLLNQRIQLSVPLDYSSAKLLAIKIVANVTQKYDKKLHTSIDTEVTFPAEPKPIAYCQGGPGFPCAVPLSCSSITGYLVEKGYQIIYYDQRGTGLSSPLEVDTLLAAALDATSEEAKNAKMFEYILHFRADSIVRDMEALRRALLKERKWLLLGQSYGGFCAFTYLSLYHESLEAVLITGGVPPIVQSADRVYEQTYKRTKERNVHYYRKYPQDVNRVKKIIEYLSSNTVHLPAGGVLSPERFQQLGIRFGATGGTDTIHQLVVEFSEALETIGKPTYSVLHKVEAEHNFDTNILYALFQEAIYCNGPTQGATRWAADRLRYSVGNENFVVTPSLLRGSEPVFFTGEMVYKLMFDDYTELRKIKQLGYDLHTFELWSELYNTEKLSRITFDEVPIVAATYYYDQYVDFELTMETKKVFQENGNLRQYISSDHFHSGLRADTSRVLGALFKLLDSEID